MSSMLQRFGPGTGSANRPAPYAGPESFIFPNNSTPQTESSASSGFSGLDGRTDLPAPVHGNEQYFGHNAGTQGHGLLELHMDATDDDFGGSVTPDSGELPSRTQSPTTDEPPSPHHQITVGQLPFGSGHTPSHSRDYTVRGSSSPAPTLAGIRRTRGHEVGSSFSQSRSGSTTHHLRAFATRASVDLKLSRSQSDELVKMAEVCPPLILLDMCVLMLHAQMPLMEMIIYSQAHMYKLENQMIKCVGKLYQRHPDFFVSIYFISASILYTD